MKKIVEQIRKLFNLYRLISQRKYVLKTEGKYLSELKLQTLTKQEKLSLKEQWGVLNLKIYDDFYKMYKTIDKFNPQYLSDDLYYPYILRKLNPIEYSVALCHKAFYDKLFPHTKQPMTYIKRIRGVFYNSDCEVVSKDEAKIFVMGTPSFIIKPTIDTCVGKNVYKITNPTDIDILGLFEKVGRDFIIQEVLEQSEQTTLLNPTSLNTFRISTLYLNGVFSVCNICIKMGRAGSFVDNLGAGGLMIGVRQDGSLFDYAYDSKYNKHYQNGDYVFKGKRIEGIDNIIQFVERLHTSHLPHLSFVGWDIAFDKDNVPTLIEVNLKWPGIQFGQLCCTSPLFGDRTDEVIQFVRHKIK